MIVLTIWWREVVSCDAGSVLVLWLHKYLVRRPCK